MTFLNDELNEHGVLCTRFKCDFCGEEFTVVPEVAPERYSVWAGCLATTCTSYDPDRDVDRMLDTGIELEREEIPVIRELPNGAA